MKEGGRERGACSNADISVCRIGEEDRLVDV